MASYNFKKCAQRGFSSVQAQQWEKAVVAADQAKISALLQYDADPSVTILNDCPALSYFARRDHLLHLQARQAACAALLLALPRLELTVPDYRLMTPADYALFSYNEGLSAPIVVATIKKRAGAGMPLYQPAIRRYFAFQTSEHDRVSRWHRMVRNRFLVSFAMKEEMRQDARSSLHALPRDYVESWASPPPSGSMYLMPRPSEAQREAGLTLERIVRVLRDGGEATQTREFALKIRQAEFSLRQAEVFDIRKAPTPYVP